ncbi:MAG: hypothetical protein RJA22_614 [Verrucomicrobiota bacterium]|jgi:ceramide glucosyltransferase
MNAGVFLGALALLSGALAFWQLLAGLRFPLHRRGPGPRARPAPGVTLLKPLKGVEESTRECLRSWLAQDYGGEVEVLFGVADAADPVCGLVRELMAAHPGVRARLVVGVGPGMNPKVATLARLELEGRHELVLVSDADVWVPPDFLGQAVAVWEGTGDGLVHALYRWAGARGWAMRWEALAVNADFWSQVLQARSLGPMRFALGAAMLLSRRRLAAVGGWAALGGYLAEDRELGRRVAQAGGQVVLTPVVAECRGGAPGWGEAWAHQLRWARTLRACQPWGYAASLLGNATLWPLLWMMVAPSPWSLAGGGVLLAGRMGQALLLERRMNGRAELRSGGLALAKDVLQVALWLAAFAGGRVLWRGVRLRVGRGGRLAAPSGR